MTTKPKKQSKSVETKPLARKVVPLYVLANDSEEDAARKYSALMVSPELAASRVVGSAEVHTGFGKELDVPTLMERLKYQGEAVNRGDLSQAEAMLINQATALQSLFARLAERGMTCTSLPQYEADMRIALRAQSQCRATLETLSAIKNPPVVYAKQANFANGPQQVNNGTVASSQAGEKENEPIKLSGSTYELLPDTGASGLASRVNQEVETVGTLNGAEVAGRQSEGIAEC
jgi:hypothetical protein